MTDKELIKQEIESYKESMKGLEPHSDFRRGQITAYNQIMQFIDSLPEEPASEDLEEEIKNYFSNWLTDLDNHKEFLLQFAHHFAEWQKQKDMQDFLEKAEKFFKNELYVSISDQVCSHNNFTSMSNFIEQFKNYMQDEM